MTEQVSLLHISDIHFGCSDDTGTQERVLDALQEALDSNCQLIDVVVFTGDLTHRSSASEYRQAQEWLIRVSELANAPCILIPGNHDIDRNRVDLKVLRSAYHDRDAYKRWQPDIFKNHGHMQPFLTWFSEAKAETPLLINDWSTNPALDVVKGVFGGMKCVFICVNSALLSCDRHDRGRLCIDTKGVNSALNRRASENNLVVLLSHHPLDELAPWNKDEIQTILDQETGPHLFMHGHLHDQQGGSRYSSNGAGSVVISAGAIYPEAKYPKFFSIVTIDIANKRVTPDVFAFSDSAGRWLRKPDQSRAMPARLPAADRCMARPPVEATKPEAFAKSPEKLWKNPFADVVANGLPPDAVHGLFVCQTGPLTSLKNSVDTIVEGQRGTGKTMLLRYFSVDVQCSMIANAGGDDEDAIRHFRKDHLPLGVYCCLTNAGVNRSDFEVVRNQARQRALFEHVVVLFVLCRTIAAVRTLAEHSSGVLLSRHTYLYICKILRIDPLEETSSESERLHALLDDLELQRIQANQYLSSLLPGGSPIDFNPWLDLPFALFSVMSRIKEGLALTAPVFILLDDFDQFTQEQQEILFNAAAARRHDVLCFKFGVMSEGQKAFTSGSGRTYREGDDYNFVRLDWSDDSLNQYTRTLDEIVSRRLIRSDWPAHITLASLLDNWAEGAKYRDEARKSIEADVAHFPDDVRGSKLKEMISAQGNSRYFKLLTKKGAFHRYAGKLTVIHLSSGIFRQFLELCSAIVEAALSDPRWSPDSNEKIGTEKQDKAVRAWSRDMYRHLGTAGDVSALNNRSQIVRSQHLINLAKSLSKFFQAKLEAGGDNSDSITISVKGFLAPDSFAKALLDVAVRESVLQRRMVDYTAKSGSGERLPTYRLNRRLAPSVGIGIRDKEPQGRHELKAELIELAASDIKSFLEATLGTDHSQSQLDI